jgi:hypothetical protein
MKKYLALLLIFSFFSFIFPVPALAQTTSLEIDPASGTFNRGCSFTLKVLLKTGGAPAEGVDTIIIYDTTRLTADSVTKGTLFPDYPIKNIDSASGRIAISAIGSVGSPFTGSGEFASINFTIPSTAQTGTTQVNLEFDAGNKAKTTDSNVSGVQGGMVVDMLDSVLNGTFTIGSGACTAQPSPLPSAIPGTATTGTTTTPGAGFISQYPGQGSTYISTPPAQPKTLDQFVDGTGKGPGTPQLTFTLAIVGSILTVLGILGLALL